MAAFVRRQLGQRLEQLRKEAGVSTVDVEASGIVSRMTLWRIEQGATKVRSPIVRELCELYGADEETTHAYTELAKARGDSWYERYGDAVPKRLELYYGAELAACQIDSYDPEVVPGLLQTREYARAIFLGEDKSPGEVTTLVDARIERQEWFWLRRPEGAILRVVLNQAALARQVGGRATMRRQVEHLREIGDREGVELVFLPWTAGAHRAIYGGYTIFQFPDLLDPTVLHLENYAGGTFLTEAEAVSRILDVQKQIIDRSLPFKEYRS